MNFDDIKSAWNSEEEDHVVVPSSVDQLKTLQTPIEKIRTNMQYEFYIQLFALVVIGFVPRYTYFNPVLVIPFYVVYFVALIISGYYFFKFYLFYKRLSTNTLRSRDHLYALYYEARLNIEMYKSFAYTLIPLALIGAALYVVSQPDGKLKDVFQIAVTRQGVAVSLVVLFLLVVLLIMVITELWVRSYYGRYLDQIKRVLDEFKENE
ncbi:hypothetical protein [Chitinophaga sp. RAB17]|uniref:hypothetical protein n=1 Tax=Chitinophaga sp. RAB17 TaxID=3233049 RepID=UPI003F8DDBEF